jgi:hypothetical protein
MRHLDGAKLWGVRPNVSRETRVTESASWVGFDPLVRLEVQPSRLCTEIGRPEDCRPCVRGQHRALSGGTRLHPLTRRAAASDGGPG